MSAIVWGVGQLGAVFAHGLLRRGHPVTPIRRGDDPAEVARRGTPELVMITVGEPDLPGVLEHCPEVFRDRLVLVQNELLPASWTPYPVEPTVAVVWFEKKKATALHPIVPTPVAGRLAAEVVACLSTIDVPAVEVPIDRIVPELVLKNLYILAANIGGLAVGGGTVGELMDRHRPLVDELTHEIVEVQSQLTREPLDESELRSELLRVFRADPDHAAMGRTAPARLRRFVAAAQELGVPVPRAVRISRSHD
ncbi:MAG: hypothetical protein AAGF12_31650 [Myxococcota bacterium]